MFSSEYETCFELLGNNGIKYIRLNNLFHHMVIDNIILDTLKDIPLCTVGITQLGRSVQVTPHPGLDLTNLELLRFN